MLLYSIFRSDSSELAHANKVWVWFGSVKKQWTVAQIPFSYTDSNRTYDALQFSTGLIHKAFICFKNRLSHTNSIFMLTVFTLWKQKVPNTCGSFSPLEPRKRPHCFIRFSFCNVCTSAKVMVIVVWARKCQQGNRTREVSRPLTVCLIWPSSRLLLILTLSELLFLTTHCQQQHSGWHPPLERWLTANRYPRWTREGKSRVKLTAK